MESLKLSCRVCLQYYPDMYSFTDELECEHDYIQLSELFKEVTAVEVTDLDDGKPYQICQDCTERLLYAYSFVCSVEKAEKDIESYLNSIIQTENETCERDYEVVTNDIDVQDIEILDEEFQIEHDQPTVDNEIIVTMEDSRAESGEENADSNINPDKTEETKGDANTLGSRLSKRMWSSHHHYKCSSCQRAFAKLETLDRHMKMAHTAIPREELANISFQVNSLQSDKQISCSYCPQKFKRRNNYIRHLTTIHSDQVEHLSEEDKELIKTKHNYKRSNCPYCGKNFTQASLIVHIRRHTGDNPYECDYCEKAFPRRQDLVVHQRMHTGEKPHICTICGKSFSRTNKLARHMRVHTGERPYKCTKCQRSFAQSNDLKIHMRRHTGEKPYKCNVCMAAFICGAALRTHRRQKNHHSPQDEFDDPFANWRVCKRELIPNNDDVNSTQLTTTKVECKEESLEF